MNKRDWLISKGLAKPGRGKFSNAAKLALAEAEKAGTVFDDAPVKVKAPRVQKDIVETTTPPEPADDIVMFENEMPHYGKQWYYLNTKGKKKSLSDRAVCTKCGYSLIAHICNSPEVLAGDEGKFVKAVF